MNSTIMKRAAAVLFVAGVLVLTGCFARFTVDPLWTPDQANLEVDPPEDEAVNAGSATPEAGSGGGVPTSTLVPASLVKELKVPVTYQLVQPKAKPVDWSRDENFQSGKWDASSKIAAGEVHYIKVKSDFIYNFETEQFLVLPAVPVTTPGKATPEEPKLVVPSPVPVDSEGTALDTYYHANKLYNDGEFLKALRAYQGFNHKYPMHEKINHVRFGLALCHFSLGQLVTAEHWLKGLSTSSKSKVPDSATVNLLLAQCRNIRTSGQQVKGGKVFELKLEETNGALKSATLVTPPVVTVGGLFRPWETPPSELTLLHQYKDKEHSTFFKTGVLDKTRIREAFEKEYKKEGRPGWLLPRKYASAEARELKGDLRLVVRRLVSRPNSLKPGELHYSLRLISIHVIDRDGKKHYATGLKPVTVP